MRDPGCLSLSLRGGASVKWVSTMLAEVNGHPPHPVCRWMCVPGRSVWGCTLGVYVCGYAHVVA